MTNVPVIFAATDIGSNATKTMVWAIGPDKHPRERFQKRFPLRLDDVFRTRRIGASNLARLLETFIAISAICREHGARRARAVATDAFRAAENARQVAEAIALETGIEIEVLSTREEGRLIAEGVLLDDADRRGRFLILDIGGGSADIILPERNGGVRSISLPLGAVRLREMFVRSDPMAPPEYAAMSEHVEKTIAHRLTALDGRWSSQAVGCGGGVRFLHTMTGVYHSMLAQDQPLRHEQLEHLRDAIWPLRVGTLVEKYGVDHERAEIIVPGAVVLAALMKRLGLKALRPSARGVRDGLLAEFLRTLP